MSATPETLQSPTGEFRDVLSQFVDVQVPVSDADVIISFLNYGEDVYFALKRGQKEGSLKNSLVANYTGLFTNLVGFAHVCRDKRNAIPEQITEYRNYLLDHYSWQLKESKAWITIERVSDLLEGINKISDEGLDAFANLYTEVRNHIEALNSPLLPLENEGYPPTKEFRLEELTNNVFEIESNTPSEESLSEESVVDLSSGQIKPTHSEQKKSVDNRKKEEDAKSESSPATQVLTHKNPFTITGETRANGKIIRSPISIADLIKPENNDHKHTPENENINWQSDAESLVPDNEDSEVKAAKLEIPEAIIPEKSEPFIDETVGGSPSPNDDAVETKVPDNKDIDATARQIAIAVLNLAPNITNSFGEPLIDPEVHQLLTDLSDPNTAIFHIFREWWVNDCVDKKDIGIAAVQAFRDSMNQIKGAQSAMRE